VARAWERQAFPKTRLQNLGLHVIFRGVPSDAGGPDYQDAILARRDGKVLFGDIEFHTRASDWIRHGHHCDHRYNNVKLHVVWRDDNCATLTANGEGIPILEVHTSDAPGEYLFQQPALTEHPCVARFEKFGTGEIVSAINRAGLARFDEKKEIFEADISALGTSQAAYRSIFGSLGFASNRSNFEALAEVAPYAWLRCVPRDSWRDVLLNAAGLGPMVREAPPARLKLEDWRLARIRPANHPARRISAIATLLAGMDGDLGTTLAEWVANSSHPHLLRQRLMVACADGGAIGAGRADEIAVSVVLPFVAALDTNDETPRQLFTRYPSPPANRWTRLMLSMLADAGHHLTARRAIEHQGLHGLYHSHCRYERRALCHVCA